MSWILGVDPLHKGSSRDRSEDCYLVPVRRWPTQYTCPQSTTSPGPISWVVPPLPIRIGHEYRVFCEGLSGSLAAAFLAARQIPRAAAKCAFPLENMERAQSLRISNRELSSNFAYSRRGNVELPMSAGAPWALGRLRHVIPPPHRAGMGKLCRDL
jgi:hypothetical protein